ncbi:BLUF domain-containing protein [Marinobacter sp. C2H3]|uniref:BLUF domain-containing protein n=1 Tax=Marinobacter sp. C2H3 TaxID=3119003 RepID=UPI00300F7BA9
MSLIRLAYASEATFEATPVTTGVEPTVARILLTSRRNNARSNLVGGLYYGDGYFFQYLEGDEEDVRDTYGRIQKDDRHTNLITLIDEPLSAPTFKNWSMKYVPLSSDVQALLARHRMTRFEPHRFSAQQCEDMIDLIRQSSANQKLVNHDDAERGGVRMGDRPQAFSPALRYGLLAAGVCLLGALIYAGTLL